MSSFISVSKSKKQHQQIEVSTHLFQWALQLSGTECLLCHCRTNSPIEYIYRHYVLFWNMDNDWLHCDGLLRGPNLKENVIFPSWLCFVMILIRENLINFIKFMRTHKRVEFRRRCNLINPIPSKMVGSDLGQDGISQLLFCDRAPLNHKN